MQRLIYLLFFISGATGLVYEVLWMRLLSQVFGSTVFAISSVLAVFMAGLGLGAYAWGRRLDRGGSGLRLYGLLELGIGIVGTLVPALIHWLDPLIVRLLVASQDLAVLQAVIRIAFAALLLGLPAFLMGGTLPALSKSLTRETRAVGHDVGMLYAVNTAGAVLGAFTTGFLLIAYFGLWMTGLLTAATNVAIGLYALRLARSVSPDAQTTDDAPRPLRSGPADRLNDRRLFVLLLAYGLSGFVALAAEVVWVRALVFFLGNSTYAFSTVLTTFLLGLATGGWIGSQQTDRLADPWQRFAVVEWLIAVSLLGTILMLWQGFYSELFRRSLHSPAVPWLLFLAIKFGAAFLVLFLPGVLFGYLFPVVCKLSIRTLASLGRGVGTVYGINTLGTILGSLASGFVLIPWLGLQQSLLLLVWLALAVTVLLIWSHPSANRTTRWAVPGAVASTGMLVIWLFPVSSQLTRFSPEHRLMVRELFYAEDHTATVHVFESAAGDRFVSVDGHFIGATEHESDKKQKLLAHLPLLLHPQPTSAITIGLGSGITLAAMARHASLQTVEAIEIVPGMLRAATFFAEANDRILESPRVRVRVGDGLHFLKTTPQRYDLIISDAKLNPEYVGNARVYTRDYYEWCRDRLTDQGIFCQWVPLYLPPSIFRMVLRTFAEVFPVVDLWFFPQQHFILMGRKQPYPFDWQMAGRRMQVPAIREHLQPFFLENPLVLASSWVADRRALLAHAGRGPVNTLARPRIEFASVRAFRQAPRGRTEADHLQWVLNQVHAEPDRHHGILTDSLAAYVQSFQRVLHGLIQARQTGLLARAETGLAAALRLNPGDGRARDLLQQIQKEQRTVLQAPANAATGQDQFRRAQLLYEHGRLAKALQAVEQVLADAPEHADGLNLKGLILLKQNRPQLAAEVFRQAHAEDQTNVDILLNLATATEMSGNMEQALQLLHDAQALAPRSAKITNNIGVLLARMQRLAEAETALQQAIRLDPLFAEAYNNLGIVYSRAGRLDRAVEMYEKVLQLHPDHAAAQKNLAMAVLQMERFERAALLFEAIVQKNPRDADAWVNLGLAKVRLGQPLAAKSCWEKALQIDPKLTEARRNLEILKQMGYD
ncbi:MAG: fused MFS/spermidine synthase [candidate division KSB1 bacterium]|nr:fused MFS/spermidine synthase [candidate division KSB1 bacterium]